MLKCTFQLIVAAAATLFLSSASAQQGRPDETIAKGDESLGLHTRAARANTESLARAEPKQLTAYDQGWRDGCTTGLYVRALPFNFAPLPDDRLTQDAERFRTNGDYVLGWGDGMNTCDAGRSGR
jgi:hypothetical protein